jgi:hypothetical protein
MAKKKIRKRKRKFNLQTTEGKFLASENVKLFNAFPDKTKRKNYLKALIEEFDALIGVLDVQTI